jgi:hypothetical protein
MPVLGLHPQGFRRADCAAICLSGKRSAAVVQFALWLNHHSNGPARINPESVQKLLMGAWLCCCLKGRYVILWPITEIYSSAGKHMIGHYCGVFGDRYGKK